MLAWIKANPNDEGFTAWDQNVEVINGKEYVTSYDLEDGWIGTIDVAEINLDSVIKEGEAKKKSRFP